MLWVQPLLQPNVSQIDAAGLCQTWNSSLIVVPDSSVQAALVEAVSPDVVGWLPRVGWSVLTDFSHAHAVGALHASYEISTRPLS